MENKLLSKHLSVKQSSYLHEMRLISEGKENRLVLIGIVVEPFKREVFYLIFFALLRNGIGCSVSHVFVNSWKGKSYPNALSTCAGSNTELVQLIEHVIR